MGECVHYYSNKSIRSDLFVVILYPYRFFYAVLFDKTLVKWFYENVHISHSSGVTGLLFWCVQCHSALSITDSHVAQLSHNTPFLDQSKCAA